MTLKMFWILPLTSCIRLTQLPLIWLAQVVEFDEPSKLLANENSRLCSMLAAVENKVSVRGWRGGWGRTVCSRGQIWGQTFDLLLCLNRRIFCVVVRLDSVCLRRLLMVTFRCFGCVWNCRGFYFEWGMLGKKKKEMFLFILLVLL